MITATNDAINKYKREKNIRTYPHHGEKSEQIASLHTIVYYKKCSKRNKCSKLKQKNGTYAY